MSEQDGGGAPLGETARCPSCQAVLLKCPQRKTKCRECGQPIYVKTLPTTRERVLATAAQAEAIEAEWAARSELASLESYLKDWHLSLDVFHRRLASGADNKPRDILWGMANESLQGLMRAGDFQGLKARYYDMALFVGREGHDPTYLLRAAHQAELQGYLQLSVVRRVSVLTCGPDDACAACLELEGKEFSIEEALRLMPIPCPACTTDVVGTGIGFCRCLYSPIID